MLQNVRDIVRQVNRLGFLPFFKGEIEEFSIEEQVSPDSWFQDEEGGYGVWDWKNDIIIDGDCAYGKFYRGKACFVSMEWYPDLVNWRRSRYCPTEGEQALLAAVQEHGSLLSSEMKKLCGYGARKQKAESAGASRSPLAPQPTAPRKGFDGAMTRLQMGGALLSANFEYSYARDGHRYGWSVARYCTPEEFFGADRLPTGRTPEESRQRLKEHLASVLPQASEKQIDRILD